MNDEKDINALSYDEAVSLLVSAVLKEYEFKRWFRLFWGGGDRPAVGLLSGEDIADMGANDDE